MHKLSMFSHKKVRGTPCKQHPPSWASAKGPSSLTHLLRVSRNERKNITIHNPIKSGPVTVGSTGTSKRPQLLSGGSRLVQELMSGLHLPPSQKHQ